MKRKLTTVRCNACGRKVDVGYPYAVETHTVTLADHPAVAGIDSRCAHAGLVLIDHDVIEPHAMQFAGYRAVIAQVFINGLRKGPNHHDGTTEENRAAVR